MNKEQALSILVQVAHIAQKAGALTLADAANVLVAIETLKPAQDKTVTEEPVTETPIDTVAE